jgi:hypothetical protein
VRDVRVEDDLADGSYPQYVYAEEGHPEWKVALSVAVVAVLSVALLLPYRKRPWLAVGWLWFLGTLVPVIGIVQVGSRRWRPVHVRADDRARDRGVVRRGGDGRRSETARKGAIALASLCSSRGRRSPSARSAYWKDDRTLFGHVVEVARRTTIARGALGNAAFKENRFEDAIREYTEARR